MPPWRNHSSLLGISRSIVLSTIVLPPLAAQPLAERMPPPRRQLSGLCADLEQGWTNLAEIALQNGAPLDGPDPEDPGHRPPLICAAQAGQVQAVAFLLAKGAKVDVRRSGLLGPVTPLVVAAEHGHGEVVKLLLAAGASVQVEGAIWTPLMWAAFESDKRKADGYVIAMEALLAAGADPNASSTRGESALSLAIGNRNAAGVRLLLSKGADPNKPNENGRSPLSLVAEGQDLDMLQALLKAGAKVEATDVDGKTPWVRAAENANRTIMQRLVAAGARQRFDRLDRDKTLRSAACEGDLPLLKRLLGAKTAELRKGGRFATLVALAAKCNRIEMVRFLLQQGADPNIAGENGETPLMTALEDFSSTGREAAPRTQLASLLIARGADANAQDSQGRTPLLRAIAWDNPGAVQLLLMNKADPNKADEKGELPLLRAVEKGEARMAKALLEAGADPNRTDKDGKTAWVLASQQTDKGMTALLEKAGARPDFAAMNWKGSESKITSLFQKAILTEAEWVDLWKRAFDKEAPPMDFTRYFVACAFLGHDAGWWYSIGFDKPIIQEKTLLVSFALVMLRVEAEPGAFDRPGFRGQYAMQVFPKREGVEVVVHGHSPEHPFPGLEDAVPGGRPQADPMKPPVMR